MGQITHHEAEDGSIWPGGGRLAAITRRDFLASASAASLPRGDAGPRIRGGAEGVLAMGGLEVQVERCRHYDHTGSLCVWGYIDPATLPARVRRRADPGDAGSLREAIESVLRGHGTPFVLRFRAGRRFAGSQGRVCDVVPFVRGDLRRGLIDVAGLPLRRQDPE